MTTPDKPAQSPRAAETQRPGRRLQHPYDKLTDLEIRTLVYVYTRHTAKDIARIEGVSPDAVVARINRARSKLGGISRLDAARRIVAAIPPEAYHSIVPQPMGLLDRSEPEHLESAMAEEPETSQTSSRIWRFPLPSKARPVNDDPLLHRIVWPIAVAVLIVLAMAVLQAVMVGLDRLRL